MKVVGAYGLQLLAFSETVLRFLAFKKDCFIVPLILNGLQILLDKYGLRSQISTNSRGGGVPQYCWWYGDVPFLRGTFFKPLRNYGYHFHNFLTFHGIMGVLFRGFFIISGIIAQKYIRFVELWP